MKRKLIEVYEEWRKGWKTPDIFVYKTKGKKVKKIYLRFHTGGE